MILRETCYRDRLTMPPRITYCHAMLKYFPFTQDRFEHQFGIQAVPDDESIIETTSHYVTEVSMRRDMLARSTNDYFQWFPQSLDAQRQASELIIQSAPFLAHETNSLMGDPIDMNHQFPLLEIARHVQEDLAIVRRRPVARISVDRRCDHVSKRLERW